jgi:integrase
MTWEDRMARKVDPVLWEERLRSLGVSGKIPGTLTQAVVDAVQRRTPGPRALLTDGKVPVLVLDVLPDGSAGWILHYRALDKSRTVGLGGARDVPLAEARAAAEKIRVQLRSGVDPLEKAREDKQQAKRALASTLGAYLRTVYAPEILAHRKDGGCPDPEKKDDKGSGTFARINAAWKPLLDKSLTQITKAEIERTLAARKAKDKAAGTLHRDWTALRALLGDALERGHLSALPMTRRPEPIRKLRGNQRVRWLGQFDEKEPKRFEDALAAHESAEAGGGDFLRCVTRLALATGMRRGELVRLTNKLINTRERRIELTAEITKSNKARTVYLSDAALAALKLWEIRGTGGELFPGDPERWEDRITQREWPRLCEQGKLEDLHFHDTRHDYAVRLLRSCGSLAKVRDALGHASIAQTEKYAHVAGSEVRDAVLAM